MRIIYDADYDYYENLMCKWLEEVLMAGPVISDFSSTSSTPVNVVGGGADGDGTGHGGSNDGKRPGDQSGSNWRQPNKHDDRYGPGGSQAGGGASGGGGGLHGGGGSGGSRLPPGEGVDYGRPYDRYPDMAGNEYGR